MRIKIVLVVFLAFVLCVACGEGSNEFVDGDSDIDDAEQGSNDDTLIINEIVAKSSTDVDWIELYNASDSDLDISNYQLMDSKDTEAYIIPAGTIIDSNSYMVFERDKTGENSFAFGLASEDAVRLFDFSGDLVDSTNWLDGEAPEGKSWGRYPNGSGSFSTLLSPSKGAANQYSCGDGLIDDGEECDSNNMNDLSCASLGFASGTMLCTSSCAVDFSNCVYDSNEVVINEVVAKSTDEAEESLPDWIELYNPGDRTNISGWMIKDSNDNNVYTIEEDMYIESGEYLVFEYDKTGLTGFDFGLGVADSVRLYNRLIELVDETSWEEGQAPEGSSWGRIPDGTGSFITLETITKGSANIE